MALKVRISVAGGATTEIESDKPVLIADLLERAGFDIATGATVSKNGKPSSPEDVAEPGDVVTVHESPEGN